MSRSKWSTRLLWFKHLAQECRVEYGLAVNRTHSCVGDEREWIWAKYSASEKWKNLLLDLTKNKWTNREWRISFWREKCKTYLLFTLSAADVLNAFSLCPSSSLSLLGFSRPLTRQLSLSLLDTHRTNHWEDHFDFQVRMEKDPVEGERIPMNSSMNVYLDWALCTRPLLSFVSFDQRGRQKEAE